MADIEVRLNTGDVNPREVHRYKPEGRPVILDVELTTSPARALLSGCPEDLRIIARDLIEIADDAEPPTVESTEADYDAADRRAELQKCDDYLTNGPAMAAAACTCDAGGWDGVEPRDPEDDIDCPLHGCTCGVEPTFTCDWTSCSWCSRVGGDCPGELAAGRNVLLAAGRCPDCRGRLKDNGPSGDRHLWVCTGQCGSAFSTEDAG